MRVSTIGLLQVEILRHRRKPFTSGLKALVDEHLDRGTDVPQLWCRWSVPA
jgi:hypothetical protein